jgi:hypothetical protein
VVIWNLKTEKKTFLPRLNGEVLAMGIDNSSQVLAVNTNDNSIKLINMFNGLVLTEISGLCIKGASVPNSVKNLGENLLIHNQNSGKIQLYNFNRKTITSNLSVINKNFVSKTEREAINLRQLKLVEVDLENSRMVTYEEIRDNDFFINSYVKLFKIELLNQKFKSELLCISENPHNNESIKNVLSDEDGFITYSSTHFKYWNINSDSTCELAFSGNYKRKPINSMCVLGYHIYSLHGNILVQWNKIEKCISNVFVLNCFDKTDVLTLTPSHKNLIIHSKNRFVLFNINEWDIIFSNKSQLAEIQKITVNDNNDFFVLLKNESYYFLLKYFKSTLASGFVIKKKNISFIDYDSKKNNFIIVGHNSEIFISAEKGKKKEFLGKKKEKPNKPKIISMDVIGNPEVTNSYKFNDEDMDNIFEANLNRIKIKK